MKREGGGRERETRELVSAAAADTRAAGRLKFQCSVKFLALPLFDHLILHSVALEQISVTLSTKETRKNSSSLYTRIAIQDEHPLNFFFFRTELLSLFLQNLSLLSPPSSTYDGLLELDVGNMTAFDPSPSGKQAEALVGDGGKTLLPLATAAAQALVAALWSLPASSASSANADGGAGAAPVAPVPGRVVDLPKPSTSLPRAKPPPQPRAPTRWEAFAARKGIDKKAKRSKLVFDEGEGEWRRRHGYKRAGDDSDIPIVDAKPGDGPGSDPFGEAALARKERVRKNRSQQLGNIKASAKALSQPSLALPPTLALASSLPRHGAKGRPAKGDAARDTLRSAARQAGVSTASMGKHDVLTKGEKREERARALAGNRRTFAPLTGRAAGDSFRDASVVDRILRATADDIDVPLAVSRLEQERRATVRAARAEVDGGGEKEDWRAKGRKGVRRSKAGRPPGMHGALPAAKKGRGKGGSAGGGVGKGGKAKSKR